MNPLKTNYTLDFEPRPFKYGVEIDFDSKYYRFWLGRIHTFHRQELRAAGRLIRLSEVFRDLYLGRIKSRHPLCMISHCMDVAGIFLYKHFRTWPEFSGFDQYPIPESFLVPLTWSIRSPHGRARRRLANHVSKELWREGNRRLDDLGIKLVRVS